MGCIMIDDSIIESNKINSTEKLVYGVITSLAKQKGYCWGSNEYLAKKLNLSKRTITKSISDLKKANLIRVENVNYERKIYLADESSIDKYF